VDLVSVAPALSIGGTKGVGIGAAINLVYDTTRAIIGDPDEAVAPGGYGGITGVVTAWWRCDSACVVFTERLECRGFRWNCCGP
jgi:hypothetical protein